MINDDFLFWILSFITLASALVMVLVANPIYSALALVMVMVGISGLFVTLNAFFLAGVQLIIYAGAVMVLFVMVLMLFDLKKEVASFTKGRISALVKLGSVGILSGLLIGSVLMGVSLRQLNPNLVKPIIEGDTTKEIGKLLFSKYLFGFELLGLLLLVVAIGTVALALSKGGTHARD